MGLANLVPGISGGTMLLASGIYPRFIRAIAEVTTLKFRMRSLVVLVAVAGSAALAILLLAGVVKGLVVDHRWIMYSLFIGLTLGGLPIVWRMARPVSPAVWAGAAGGFAAMAALVLMQQFQVGSGGDGANGAFMLCLAGVAGASAMILPGVSGGYLLLVLGQYVPILSAVDQLKDALGARDWSVVWSVGWSVCVPVGVGVVIGMVVVSNLLRLLLKKCPKATLGVLLGLLLGAVVGLWPFQQGVQPAPGDVVKGQVMTEATLSALEPEDFPTVFFSPTWLQIVGALGFAAAGFGVTRLIDRFGGGEDEI